MANFPSWGEYIEANSLEGENSGQNKMNFSKVQFFFLVCIVINPVLEYIMYRHRTGAGALTCTFINVNLRFLLTVQEF